jgi:hypothetical protein
MNKKDALETWLQVDEWYTLVKQVVVMWNGMKWSRIRSVGGICLQGSITLGNFVRGCVIINPFTEKFLGEVG